MPKSTKSTEIKINSLPVQIIGFLGVHNAITWSFKFLDVFGTELQGRFWAILAALVMFIPIVVWLNITDRQKKLPRVIWLPILITYAIAAIISFSIFL